MPPLNGDFLVVIDASHVSSVDDTCGFCQPLATPMVLGYSRLIGLMMAENQERVYWTYGVRLSFSNRCFVRWSGGRGASRFFPALKLLAIRSADILVRPFRKVDTEADKNVRAPKKLRCAGGRSVLECDLQF
jgi:hypothetical protein